MTDAAPPAEATHRADTSPARPDVEVEAFRVTDFIHPTGSPLAGRRGLVMAYAVRHPAGTILFDTGVGIGNAQVTDWLRAKIRDMPELLRARGVHPDEVTAIFNSHLHIDHCGQNLAFPGRPIYA